MDDDRLRALETHIGRLDERLGASDKALEVARDALRHWQASSNEWRQAMNDQRSQFVTIDRAVALLLVGVSLATLLSKLIK